MTSQRIELQPPPPFPSLFEQAIAINKTPPDIQLIASNDVEINGDPAAIPPTRYNNARKLYDTAPHEFLTRDQLSKACGIPASGMSRAIDTLQRGGNLSRRGTLFHYLYRVENPQRAHS